MVLPPGYSEIWARQFQNRQEATARLVIVVPAALRLTYRLLFIMLRSFSLAALIFVYLPFAATCGVLALWARDLPFSMSAAVAFIALSGIAVRHGVVPVSTIVERRAEGKTPAQAAGAGAMQRLRPVLMTATAVIGGLITATLPTLLVLPALY